MGSGSPMGCMAKRVALSEVGRNKRIIQSWKKGTSRNGPKRRKDKKNADNVCRKKYRNHVTRSATLQISGEEGPASGGMESGWSEKVAGRGGDYSCCCIQKFIGTIPREKEAGSILRGSTFAKNRRLK